MVLSSDLLLRQLSPFFSFSWRICRASEMHVSQYPLAAEYGEHWATSSKLKLGEAPFLFASQMYWDIRVSL